MAHFGERLRLEREGRGVSLASLSAETKVQPRYFEALEREQMQELPSGVFRRGILRAYLGALGLEEAGWMTEFDQLLEEQAKLRGEPQQSAEEAWVTFATNVKRNRLQQKKLTHWRWAGVLLLLAIVVGAGWAVWALELKQSLAR